MAMTALSEYFNLGQNAREDYHLHTLYVTVSAKTRIVHTSMHIEKNKI